MVEVFILYFQMETVWLWFKLSLRFVHKGPIDYYLIIIWTSDDLVCGYMHAQLDPDEIKKSWFNISGHTITIIDWWRRGVDMALFLRNVTQWIWQLIDLHHVAFVKMT